MPCFRRMVILGSSTGLCAFRGYAGRCQRDGMQSSAHRKLASIMYAEHIIPSAVYFASSGWRGTHEARALVDSG